MTLLIATMPAGTSTGMQDLGTVTGDVISYSTAINNKGQIVGESCDANSNCRAYLWQNGVMIDMNALITARLALATAHRAGHQ